MIFHSYVNLPDGMSGKKWTYNPLVVEPYPSKKDEFVNLDDYFIPNILKNKSNVPNHQPDKNSVKIE